jgi:TetR/AcrR family transcriptional repressor of mexJK operon
MGCWRCCSSAWRPRGQLRLADPAAAAHHFAWLLLGRTLDRAMFYGPGEIPDSAELERLADAAVAVFLAAYGAGGVPAGA